MKKSSLIQVFRSNFFLIIILFIVYWTFIIPGPRAANDFPHTYSDALKKGFNLPYVWSFRDSLGLGENVLFTRWAWPIDLIYGLGGRLGLDFSLLMRLIGVLPILTIGAWGITHLLEYFKIKKWGKLFGAIFYLTNTYLLLVIDGGQLAIGLAFIWIPIVFLGIEKAVSGGLKEKILSGLAISVLGFFDIRFVYILVILEIIRFLFEFIFLSRDEWLSWVSSWMKTAVLSICIFLGLNVYWLLPIFFSKSTNLPSEFGQPSQVSFLNFTNIGHSQLFLTPHWFRNVFGKITPLKGEFIIIPFLVFLAPFLKIKSKLIGFWLVVASISIFLVKGASSPFPSFYLWLYSNIPGFSLFRDSTKFFVLTALSFSFLLATSIDEIIMKLKRFKKIKFCLIFLIIIYFIFSVRAVWSGQMTGTFARPFLQNEYFKLANDLQKDKEFGRILWIPSKPPLGYTSPIHASIESLRLVQDRPFASSVWGSYDLNNYLLAPFIGQLLDIAGIGYIVYPTSDPRREEIKLDQLKYYKWFSDKLRQIPWVYQFQNFGSSEIPIWVYKMQKNQDLFFFPKKVWWVVGSDEIYEDIVEIPDFQLSENAFIFVEQEPELLKHYDELAIGKVILVDKNDIDVAASFLGKSHFIFPSSFLPFSPNSDGWWKRETSDLINWRAFLQEKYSIDSLDFDYSGGWAIAEGDRTLNVSNSQFGQGNVLLARVMTSPKSGKINFYQESKLIGSIVTKLSDLGKKDIYDSQERVNRVIQYDKAKFSWFEVGKLTSKNASISVETQGDINVVNALAVVSSDEWREVYKKSLNITKGLNVIYWKKDNIVKLANEFTQNEKPRVEFKEINSTDYKVIVNGVINPSLLIFSSSYDPLWEIDGQKAAPVYSLVNGFKVERDGTYEIKYYPQRYVFMGLVIAVITVFISLLYIVFGTNENKIKKNI